jgi:hypothetical protein
MEELGSKRETKPETRIEEKELAKSRIRGKLPKEMGNLLK